MLPDLIVCSFGQLHYGLTLCRCGGTKSYCQILFCQHIVCPKLSSFDQSLRSILACVCVNNCLDSLLSSEFISIRITCYCLFCHLLFGPHFYKIPVISMQHRFFSWNLIGFLAVFRVFSLVVYRHCSPLLVSVFGLILLLMQSPSVY